MATGTIKWFNVARGYGFIEPADLGKDVFVHATALDAIHCDTALDNARVTFEIVPSRRSGQVMAANVALAK
jgi:CspA family cold shock protein